jgi:protein ImuB
MAARFSAEGVLMQRLAQGDDPRPLVPFCPKPPLVEAITLEQAADSLTPVLFALKTVVDRLVARLSGRGLALMRMEVVLKLDPRGCCSTSSASGSPTSRWARPLPGLKWRRWRPVPLSGFSSAWAIALR